MKCYFDSCWDLSLVLVITSFGLVLPRMTDEKIISVDFEVHGHVQGVFFRDNTRKAAKQNGCVGWVKNTYTGTVVGQIQGPKKSIDFMKHWLSHVGSPDSTISKCNFSNEKTISEVSYKKFSIR